jgi:tripartite-type tricarboxylate transporter receptor subunit TctC
VLPHIKAGKLRALAVTTARRSVALPDVPTLDEAGLKGFDMGTWFGVLAPAATPREVLARLGADMNRIIESPQFRRKMEEIGAEPIGTGADGAPDPRRHRPLRQAGEGRQGGPGLS